MKNGVVKKYVYDKLAAQVNSIDTTGFVLKTKYNKDKSELENTTGLVKKTDYDANITDIEGKIPDVSGFATKTALTTFENKISDVSSAVKKTNYNTRVAEIDNKVSRIDGKIAENKTKNLSIENALKKLIKIWLSFFQQMYFWWIRWFSSLFSISTST